MRGNQKDHISIYTSLVNSISSALESFDGDPNAATAFTSGAALESDDPIQVQTIHEAEDAFRGLLSAAIESDEDGSLSNVVDGFTKEQHIVGTMVANIMSTTTDWKSSLEQEVAKPVSTSPNHVVIDGVTDVVDKASHALEHYDNRDMSALPSKSIMYNVGAVRPSDFVKTIFPFVVFNPGQGGVRVNVELLYRQDDVRHPTSGDVVDFKRRNLTLAEIDGDILRDDSTRIIPVRNAQSDHHFVDAAVIPNFTALSEGVSVPTNFLNFGQKHNLIGISQTDAILATGAMNATDQLDLANSISTIAVQMGADILELNLGAIQGSSFSNGHPGVGTTQTLTLSTTSIVLDATSTARGGAAFTEGDLLAIGTQGLTIQIELSLGGTTDIDTGTQSVYAQEFSVVRVLDASGVERDLADAAVAPIVAFINSAQALGYTPDSYRSNRNHRNRGRTIGSTTISVEYYAPRRSPLSTVRPTDSDRSSKDVATLVDLTHTEMTHEAVETIEKQVDALRQYQVNSNVILDRPDFLGIGRYYLNPKFIERNIDLPLQINSKTSHERMQDIRAVLLLQTRDIAARLVHESGFTSVQRRIRGDSERKPLIIISTDPYTATYFNESNGERLLGDSMDHVIVTNDTAKQRGKVHIFVSDQSDYDGINPIGAGNTLYAPEILSNLVIDRGGQTSREVTVMRHYRMFLNSNVMGVMYVKGMDDVLGQICDCGFTGGVNPDSSPYLNLPHNGTGSNSSQYW